jgi:hypothetical protein
MELALKIVKLRLETAVKNGFLKLNGLRRNFHFGEPQITEEAYGRPTLQEPLSL